MIFIKGHGIIPVMNGETKAYPHGKAMDAAAACGFAKGETFDENAALGVFSYSFPDAAGIAETDQTTVALDNLSDAMVEHNPSDDKESNIPPVFTYMGQFIDHDITANTDREGGVSVIDVEKITPLARDVVEDKHGNLRFASLNLDSLYGGAPIEGKFAKALKNALRWRKDRAKLEAGTDFDVDQPVVELPKDKARDLLRLGWARNARRKGTQITDADMANIPEGLRSVYFEGESGDQEIVQRAIIGDSRNDENLAVAQFHLAMIRLHNEIVDAAPKEVRNGGRDEVFAWAKQLTQWTYQWLIVNAYLPAICDKDTLELVKGNNAKAYRAFFDQHTPTDPELMPMPLEFSVGAFRFGHSMARHSYDWNINFGRGGEADNEARFQELFLFTGNGRLAGLPRLPSNWPIQWERFVHKPTSAIPDRAARKIDTLLALPLSDMQNEDHGDHGVLRHLARRNMRRAYRLNLPSAQGYLGKLWDVHGIDLERLSEAQLLSGHTTDQVKAGDFHINTPIWFYVLKEAEVLNDGQSLGPLGSFIVADTLIGLLECSPNSYFNAAPHGRSWEPQNSVKPNGVIIDSMAGMMSAGQLL